MEEIREHNLTEEKNNNKKLSIAIISLACVMAVIVLLSFILPDTRSLIYEKAGKFYLERENFEAANNVFLKAGKARYYNIKAWEGAVEAAQKGELENVSESFFSAHEAFMHLNYGQLNEEEVLIITEIYLSAPEIISNNEKLIGVLEDGLSALNGTRELYAPLADAWYAKAKSASCPDEEKVTAFMKTAEYTDYAQEVTLEAAEFIYGYICVLGAEKEFEKATEYIDSCSIVLEEAYDVSKLRESIGELADFDKDSYAMLEKAYEAMDSYYRVWESTGFHTELNDFTVSGGMILAGFSDMFRIDGTDVANRLAYYSRLWDETYIYSPQGAGEMFSGIGCGVYPFGETKSDDDSENSVSYYFYFGEYENGIRNGHGITFLSSVATSFYSFEGEWKDDAPNGQGIYYVVEKYDYTELSEFTETVEGSFKNGLQNGLMTVRISYNNVPGYVFKGTYEAKEGIAPKALIDTSKYTVSSNADRYPIAILLTTDDMNSYYAPLFQLNDEPLCVIGF